MKNMTTLEKAFNEQTNVIIGEMKSNSKTYGEAIEKVRSKRFDSNNGINIQLYFEAEFILEKEMKNLPIK